MTGSGITIDIDYELSGIYDDDSSMFGHVCIIASTPAGQIQISGCISMMGDTRLVVDKIQVYGLGNLKSGQAGRQQLKDVVQAIMEYINVEEIHVLEAWRVSGANPGRTVGPFAFRRRR